VDKDLLIRGAANLGQNSEVPWIRVASKSHSPSATKGWYLAYLFAADGSACWLSLGRGSTTWNGREFTVLDLGSLKVDCELLRKQVGEFPVGWDKPVNLFATKSKLGPAYESASAFTIEYESGNVPTDEILVSDLLDMGKMLSKTYALRSPEDFDEVANPEVVQAVQAIKEIAGKFPAGESQGFGLTQPQKKAVELRAIRVATEFLEDQGWTEILDVGATQSYDLDCTRANEKLFVEVKGSTGSSEKVILTKNEVLFHTSVFPKNALFVVSGIQLDKETCVATNGNLKSIQPWKIEPDRLEALSYQYLVKSPD
jgi:hypothetical protein